MPWSRALLGLTLFSGALCIASAMGVLPPALAFVFKPLTTVLVIVHAWRRGAERPLQRRLVLAGLALSLAGDVFLLWPQQGFLPGLVSFLLAHLAYIAAFCQPVRLAQRPLAYLPYAWIAGAVLWVLWPDVPAALRAPVLAYVVCLGAMAAQAAVWWRVEGGRARWAAWGAALFMLSDALLAFNKFSAPLPASALWVLSSYWVAQWLIASSLSPPRGTTEGRRHG